MRIIGLSGLLLAIFSVNLMAVPAPTDAKPPQPKPIPELTAEQLEAAKEAYAKFGAKYEPITNEKRMGTLHVFVMPRQTTDADLKGLPDLPFRFGLSLYQGMQVTDAGMKEIKNLKNLISLNLWHTQVTDAGLNELKDLKNLATLNLRGTRVTDAGMKELKDLPNLSSILLDGTQVTDASLKELKEFKSLTLLWLGRTKVTDAGLKELKEFKNLSSLNLIGTKVTDAGLKDIKELKNLTNLYLIGTKVTAAGLKEIKEALPKCDINK